MNAYLISWCMIQAALATALIQKLRGKRVLWMKSL